MGISKEEMMEIYNQVIIENTKDGRVYVSSD